MLNNTQIPAQRVPLIDDGKSLMTREWFRFFGAVYDYLGLALGIVPPTSGGTGVDTYAKGDMLYASDVNILSVLPAPGTTAHLTIDAANTPKWTPMAYGSFKASNNNSFAANVPSIIPLGSSIYTSSMTNNGTRITVGNSGTYSITVSFQITNADTTTNDDMSVWLRINGVDAPNTKRTTTLVISNGTPTSGVLTVNYFQQLTAGSYFELYGLSLLGYAQIVAYAASSSPAYPAAPSVILTVAQIV